MALKNDTREGKASCCSSILLRLYRRVESETVRSRLRKFAVMLEGGPAYSLTIRKILREFYRVDIGLYTRWPFRMKPSVFHPGTTFGRYSYISDTVRTFTLNHPMNTKSTHGFFYNPLLGKIKSGPLPRINLVIGNGVWMGHNAIILPPTERIGDGAIITAGSVVHTNVPPYAVVSGHPAQVVRYRFNQEFVAELLASRWWERSWLELADDVESFPLHPDGPTRGLTKTIKPEARESVAAPSTAR